jgi:hypothetical protein
MRRPLAWTSAWAAAAGGAAALAPAAALACPTCATRDGPGAGMLVAVGAMISLPFAVAAVTIRVIRRLERGR